MIKKIRNSAIALLICFMMLQLFPTGIIAEAADSKTLDEACEKAAGMTWYWPFSSTQKIRYSKISSSYGYRRWNGKNRIHHGVDIGAPKKTPVYSIQTGKVIKVQKTINGDAGRYIVIDHGNKFYSWYMHLQEIYVDEGDEVSLSTIIGHSGASGRIYDEELKKYVPSDDAYGPHLHLQICYGGSDKSNSINPCPADYTNKGDGIGKYGNPMENASDQRDEAGETIYGEKFDASNPRISYEIIDRGSSNIVTLNINGYLDGADIGSIDGYGTFDVYVKRPGSDWEQAADNQPDFCQAFPQGTEYRIEDIQGEKSFHTFHGLKQGSAGEFSDGIVHGTLDSSQTVVLNFRTNDDVGSNFDAYITNESGDLQLYNQYFVSSGDNVGAEPPSTDVSHLWHFEKIGGEDHAGKNHYKITSVYDGRSLDVLNFGQANGTNLQLRDYAGNNAQTWVLHEENGLVEIGAVCTPCIIDCGAQKGDVFDAYMNWDLGNEYQKFRIQYLQSDNTVYLPGEPIKVSGYATTPKAWVGLFHREDAETRNFTGDNYVFWYYLKDHPGDYDITQSDYARNFPTGEYSLVLFSEDNYDSALSITDLTLYDPSFSADRTEYFLGEAINVTVDPALKEGWKNAWVGLFKKGDIPSAENWIFWEYLRDQTSNTFDITSVEHARADKFVPGQYSLMIFSDNQYIPAKSIDITVQNTALSIDKPVFLSGEPIYVTIDPDLKEARKDAWIGLFKQGDIPSAKNWIFWEYLRNQDNECFDITSVVNARLDGFVPGQYSLMLFTHNEYIPAKSTDIMITDQRGTLWTRHTSYETGEAIPVKARSSDSGAWVGLFRKGDPHNGNTWIYWYNVSSHQDETLDLTQVANARPEQLVPGEYTLILFRDQEYDTQEHQNIETSIDITITAPVPVYTVAYNPNGASKRPPNQKKIHNEPLELTAWAINRDTEVRSFDVTLNNSGSIYRHYKASQHTYFSFNGWYSETGTEYHPGQTYMDNADLQLTARWNVTTKTESVRLPVLTRPGYVFKGWAENADATVGITDSYTPTESVTLYAIWELIPYTVSFETYGDAEIPAQTIAPGQRAVRPCVITEDDWWLIEWFTDEAFNTRFDFDTAITSDLTLYAAWEEPDFILPLRLKTIENEAFSRNVFRFVKLPENAVSIGWHAFADCPNLTFIYIPALTTRIDDDAFGNTQSLTILGKSGTAAETYAKDHHFTFIAVA